MECKYKEPDRSGLYIMVLIAMLGGCNSCEKLNEQDKKIQKIEQQLDKILKLEENRKCQ